MALKDVFKSLTGKKQNDSNHNAEVVAAALASDSFLILRASDVDTNQYRKVPLMGLAALGAAFAQLPEAARTITTTVSSSVNLKETLFVGVNPKGIAGFLRADGNGTVGNIMQINEQGKQVIAGRLRFKPINQLPVTEVTQTVVPFDPMTMVIAAALFSVNEKLDTLQQKAEEILQFLKLEKQSRQRGNLNMLADILAEYKRNCSDEKLCSLRLNAIQDIKRDAYQDILFYQKQIDNRLQEEKALHGAQQANTLLEQVISEFREYLLACYLFGFSSFLEVMLQQKFDTDELNAAAQKLKEYADRYTEQYTACRGRLADYQRTAIEARLLGGLGSVAKAAGEKLASVPVLKEGPVDEALIHAGESLGKLNRDSVSKRLEQFAPLEDSRLGAFTEQLHTIDVLCHQPDGLLTDGESLYIRTGAA